MGLICVKSFQKSGHPSTTAADLFWIMLTDLLSKRTFVELACQPRESPPLVQRRPLLRGAAGTRAVRAKERAGCP